MRGIDWPATLSARLLRLGEFSLHEKTFCLSDLRFHHEPEPIHRLHCVVVDASGSMRQAWGAVSNLENLKNSSIFNTIPEQTFAQLPRALRWLLRIAAHAYREREDWALIRFGAGGATLIDVPRRAHAPEALMNTPIHSAGGSPVAQALHLADRTMVAHTCRIRQMRPTARTHNILWLLTDGRFQPCAAARQADTTIVLDLEAPTPRRLAQTPKLAQNWGAIYWHGEEENNF